MGVGTGVLTLLGQGVLDANWNRLVNSGAVWLMVGFLSRALARRIRRPDSHLGSNAPVSRVCGLHGAGSS